MINGRDSNKQERGRTSMPAVAEPGGGWQGPGPLQGNFSQPLPL